MPKIVVLPHEEICPEGAVLEATPGDTLCQLFLDNGIDIEHACEQVCACTTCHVWIQEGYHTLEEPNEIEEDLLDKAWGLMRQSRLSCQVTIGSTDLVIEIPRYTINLSRESTIKK